jgi:2'-5' RNA ligase
LRQRLFAAVPLPPDLCAHLAAAQNAFAQQLPGNVVRWVRPEGIHLTLKFYGDVRGERAADFHAGLERAARLAGAGAAGTPLTLQGLGVFPNPSRPQVVWVGLEGDLGPLKRLQRAVEEEAEGLGYPPDGRPFAPHLTLGRVRAGLHWADQQLLLDVLRHASGESYGQFCPATLSLMASDRRPTGAVYTALFEAALTDKENAPGTT